VQLGIRTRFVLIGLVLLGTLPLFAQADPSTGYPEVDAALARLEGLSLDEFFEESFRELVLRDPEYVTAHGLSGYYGVRDDRLTDISPEYTAATHALQCGVLDLLRAYDVSQLGSEEAVYHATYEWFLDDLVRLHPYVYHSYELNGFLDFGTPGALGELFASLHPLTTRAEVEDYLTRLAQVEWKIGQLIEFVEHQRSLGIETPAFMLRSCRTAIERMLGVEHQRFRAASDVPVSWGTTFQSFDARLSEVADLTDEEKDAYRQQARQLFREVYIPAFWELRGYVSELLPDAPVDGGATILPDGEGYFAAMLRHETSTDLTADEVHQIGLREVERIQREIDEQFGALGYSDTLPLEGRWEKARSEDTYHNGSTASGFETILAILEGYREKTGKLIESHFDLWPAQTVQMLRAPAGAAANYYVSPSWDGSRPGVFYVASVGSVAESGLMAVFHHEAIPGHHAQLALAQELDLPMFMRFMTSNGLVEGWALYCERLMYDLGAYAGEPLDNLARLRLELTRAARLVVDTGIHAYGWTRQEGAAYFEGVLGYPTGSYLGAMERYVLLPGQGSSYMIGKLVIEELLGRAQVELGTAFRWADFHDVVIGHGAVPLRILEDRVLDYIDDVDGT
jgi:uncharacterized protein (DUF885 family)